MTDISAQAPDARARDTGTASTRKLPLTTTAGYSFVVAILVATVQWLMQCYTKAGWFWIPPEGSLLEMWAFALAPILHTIGRIIANKLAKLEKESEA